MGNASLSFIGFLAIGFAAGFGRSWQPVLVRFKCWAFYARNVRWPNDHGLLVLAELTEERRHSLASAQVLDGPDRWRAICPAGDRLVAGDLTTLACIGIGW